jgi:lysozyme family protein
MRIRQVEIHVITQTRLGWVVLGDHQHTKTCLSFGSHLHGAHILHSYFNRTVWENNITPCTES